MGFGKFWFKLTHCSKKIPFNLILLMNRRNQKSCPRLSNSWRNMWKLELESHHWDDFKHTTFVIKKFLNMIICAKIFYIWARQIPKYSDAFRLTNQPQKMIIFKNFLIMNILLNFLRLLSNTQLLSQSSYLSGVEAIWKVKKLVSKFQR